MIKIKELDAIYYFKPEIEQFIQGKNQKNDHTDDFDTNRKIGENHNYICKLIRDDLINDFIAYVKRNDINLKAYIKPSIYETNLLLIKTNPTLIEYAAFFGSVQIFNYLNFNGVDLTSSLWIYGIHGNNSQIINLLEDNNVHPSDKSYEACLKEAVKCHHNDVANYIINNLLDDYIEKENIHICNTNFEESTDSNLFSYSFRYYNYSYFPNDFNNKFIFYYACKYDHFTIVDSFIKMKIFDLNEAKVVYIIFFK